MRASEDAVRNRGMLAGELANGRIFCSENEQAEVKEANKGRMPVITFGFMGKQPECVYV